MVHADLEQAIQARGRQLFAGIRDETPSLFNKARWTGKVLDWAMKQPAFKVQLFRFVDVFPGLTSGAALTRHLEEYFGDDASVPEAFRWGARAAAFGGALGASLLRSGIKKNLEEMARQFIIGENADEALATLRRLRREGFAAVVDLLGEATVSEVEADRCLDTYMNLIRALDREQRAWPALAPGSGDLDWGHASKVQLSVKPTSLFSQASPMDFEGSVQGILARLTPLYQAVVAAQGVLCIDMESHRVKDITLEVYRRLRSDHRFRDFPGLAIAIQAYLRDSEA